MPEFRRNPYLTSDSEFEHLFRPGALKLILTFKSVMHGNKNEYPVLWKKTKNESDKLLSIYLRVTINGDRFEVSTQRYVETAKWSASGGKVKGNSEEARSINQHLDNLKQKIYDYQKILPWRESILQKKCCA